MSAKHSVVSLVSSADSSKQPLRTETRLLRQEGPMAASSSSREDDALSQSSGETEAMAMATLERLPKDNSNISKRSSMPSEIMERDNDNNNEQKKTKSTASKKQEPVDKSKTNGEKKHDFYDRECKHC
uniref:Uncharacterized protein n=1 Tax=Plectus sambesii TaxID=2011161 RepID=A0A914XLG3_9BILA